jgi:hypothetical protein
MPVLGGFDAMMQATVGMLPGNRLVIHAGGAVMGEGRPDSIVRPQRSVAIVDLARESMRKIATLPDRELTLMAVNYHGKSEAMSWPVYFGRRAHVAVWDTVVVTATGDGYTIDLRDSDGRVFSRITASRPRRKVTQAMREARIARELNDVVVMSTAGGEGRSSSKTEETKRVARETPFADSLPPYGAVFGTRGGILWVVDAISPSDTVWTATAFDRKGAIIGRLVLPGNASPLIITDDRAVTYYRDGEGVVTVKVFAFETPRKS